MPVVAGGNDMETIDEYVDRAIFSLEQIQSGVRAKVPRWTGESITDYSNRINASVGHVVTLYAAMLQAAATLDMKPPAQGGRPK
jgi:hypothetical protein